MLLHALPLLLAAGVSQGPLSSTEITQITVNAEARPLGELLRQFAALAAVDRLVIDPRIESRPVTINLENASPFDAFRRTLEAADVGYAIWGIKGREMRIYAAPTNDDVVETIRRADAGEAASADGAVMRADGTKDPAAYAQHSAEMEARNAASAVARAGEPDHGYELFRSYLTGQAVLPPADPAARAAAVANDPGFRAMDGAMNLRATRTPPDPAAFSDPGTLAFARMHYEQATFRPQQ
jgi:hypothetical protein